MHMLLTEGDNSSMVHSFYVIQEIVFSYRKNTLTLTGKRELLFSFSIFYIQEI